MPRKTKAADEAFCRSCGKIIKKEADICPSCGVRQITVSRGGRGKSKVAAILLAVFLAPFNWLYTYKKDAKKFWIGLALVILLFWTILVPIGVWLWAIIDSATKSDEWYENF